MTKIAKIRTVRTKTGCGLSKALMALKLKNWRIYRAVNLINSFDSKQDRIEV